MRDKPKDNLDSMAQSTRDYLCYHMQRSNQIGIEAVETVAGEWIKVVARFLSADEIHNLVFSLARNLPGAVS